MGIQQLLTRTDKQSPLIQSPGLDRLQNARAKQGATLVATRSTPGDLAEVAERTIRKNIFKQEDPKTPIANVVKKVISPPEQIQEVAKRYFKNEKLTPDEAGQLSEFGNMALMGVSSPLSASGVKGISPMIRQIHPEDQQIMEQFYNAVIGKKMGKQNLGQLGVDAQRIAEHYLGTNWATVSNQKLAKGFAFALDVMRKVPIEGRTAFGKVPR